MRRSTRCTDDVDELCIWVPVHAYENDRAGRAVPGQEMAAAPILPVAKR